MSKQQRQFLINVNKISGVRVDTLTSDCWIWDGCKNKEGYGYFQTDWAKKLKTIYAHRISYHLFREPFLPSNNAEVIMHICDNPSCVNPDHLQLGTQIENIKDRDVKGRQTSKRGSDNNFAKFTMQDVEMIRTLRMQGKQVKQIAEQFNCVGHTITYLLNGKTYDEINTEALILKKTNLNQEVIDYWIRKLHSQGQSYRKIHETVNRSVSYICNVLKKQSQK